MRRPRSARRIEVTYHGTVYTVDALRRILRVSGAMLYRWHSKGVLTEARIDKWLTERAENLRHRELALSLGINDGVRRMRLCRGKSLLEAATAPLKVWRRAS